MTGRDEVHALAELSFATNGVTFAVHCGSHGTRDKEEKSGGCRLQDREGTDQVLIAMEHHLLLQRHWEIVKDFLLIEDALVPHTPFHMLVQSLLQVPRKIPLLYVRRHLEMPFSVDAIFVAHGFDKRGHVSYDETKGEDADEFGENREEPLLRVKGKDITVADTGHRAHCPVERNYVLVR